MTIRRRKPIARSAPLRKTRPKRVNKQRKAKNWTRSYHSEERVEWVKRQPCAKCGVVGYSQNAHTEGGGMGRKAGYDTIVPLCGPRPRRFGVDPSLYEGCHAKFDRREFGPVALTDLRRFAKSLDFAWQSYCTTQSPHGEAK